MKSNSQQEEEQQLQQQSLILTSEQTTVHIVDSSLLHLMSSSSSDTTTSSSSATMDDLELVFDKLALNLNRTNSNASCNSSNSLLIDSGYISSNDLLDSSSSSTTNGAIMIDGQTSSSSHSSFSPPSSSASVSTYTLLQDSIVTTTTTSQKRPLRVTAGYYGKAKTSSLDDPMSSKDQTQTTIEEDRVNLLAYGDDVGLLLSKKEQYYFAVADGVSANRARGYDPSLFPNALLTACGHYLISHESCHLLDLITTPPARTPTSTSTSSGEGDEQINQLVSNDESNDNKNEEEEEFCDEYDEELNDAEEIYDELNDVDEEEMNNNNSNNTQVFDSSQQLLLLNENDYEEEEDDEEEVFDERETRFLFETLKSAHDTVEEQKVYGSSTVCLLSLKPDTTISTTTNSGTTTMSYLLSTCNLGDSGYMIMRDRRVIYKSPTQSHRYNAPFQIGCTPPELLDHDLYRDNADDSVRTTHRVRPGDLLIISSDGLFDNLYEDEIAMVITNHIDSQHGASDINSDSKRTTVNNKITNEMLSSACELLVRRASSAGIKRDDMLIMLIHIE